MNELRITLYRSHLLALRDTIALFTEQECVGETLHSMRSILVVMSERIIKHLAARPHGLRKDTFRITLRLHEAIALRRAALVGITIHKDDLRVQNDLREVVINIDPFLPANCKPY